MPLIETESLVLKTYNLAEADRIVVFLTRDHGIVRGVARGAKRLKSRFGSTLEPFTKIDLTYFQKEDRELVSIQSVELLSSAFDRAADLGFLDAFSEIADLLLKFAPPNDPNETLFRMVSACIAAAPGSPEGLRAIKLYFELWLLRLGGFLPDWSRCEDCKAAFHPEDEASLRGGFHLHCKRCRRSSGILQVTPRHRDLYAGVNRLAPAAFVDYSKGKESSVKDLSLVMQRLIAQILETDSSQQKEAPQLVRKNAV